MGRVPISTLLPTPSKESTTTTPDGVSADSDTNIDKANMATTFVQYCAMCEKQIMHPNHSILYCSQACRRKDEAKPLSASYLPASTTSSFAPTPPRATSPTPSSPRSPHNNNPVIRIPSDLHDHKSDLDPTEWKPKLGARTHSEAYQYLSKFHAAMTANDNNDDVKIDRPRYGRHKTTLSMTANTTPSLGNTPTTISSSFDSVYEFNTRPLQPRHNPMYALYAGTRSDELVTPHVAPPPAVDNHEIDWRKKTVIKGAVGGRDGLGALFTHK